MWSAPGRKVVPLVPDEGGDKAMTDAVVLTEGLAKRYGRQQALYRLDLAVQPDEVFGFLGPNGAGKPPPSACCST